MRRPTIILTSLLATGCVYAPLVGPATFAPQGARQCFWASQIKGFGDAGPDRAIVRISRNEMWELTLSPGCPDVNWAMKIGIVSRGGQRICTDRPAELIVPSAGGSGQRCLVRNVRKLSPAEVAAQRGLAPT